MSLVAAMTIPASTKITTSTWVQIQNGDTPAAYGARRPRGEA